MIFNLYKTVAVKIGDERYVFDRDSLMFREVVQLEDASGYSFGEWQQELGRYSIRAVGALLSLLRKRAGAAGSDFESMDFSAADLDVIPLHEDGTEFTAAEVAEDVTRRMAEAQDPTGAAGAASDPAATASTSPTSPSASESGPGSGTSSPGATSPASKTQPTQT